MEAYLVKGDGEIGLFVANDTNELFWVVDRFTSPYDCQWTQDFYPTGIMVGFKSVDFGGEIGLEFKLDESHTLYDEICDSYDKVWHSFSRADAHPVKNSQI